MNTKKLRGLDRSPESIRKRKIDREFIDVPERRHAVLAEHPTQIYTHEERTRTHAHARRFNVSIYKDTSAKMIG